MMLNLQSLEAPRSYAGALRIEGAAPARRARHGGAS